jgi:hypothetical protein
MTAARRLTLATLATLCTLSGGVLALGVTPALAATSPTVTIKPVGTVTSTTAKVSGTVNPNGSPTTVWNFQYSKDPETEGWTPSAVSGIVGGSEEVKGTIEGLQPNAAYQVRLVAANEEGGEGVSAEPNPSFTTKPAAPTVINTSVSERQATSVRLNATVNPNNEATTECKFEYGATVTEHRVPCEGEALSGFGEDGVTAVVSGLEPNHTSYKYRVVVRNVTGETIEEAATPFVTATPRGTPVGEKAQGLTGTSEELQGVLNPSNEPKADEEPGSYEFLYAKSVSTCEGESTVAEESPPEGKQNEAVHATATGLLPNETYTFCLRASNSAEPPEDATGPPVTFTTVPVKPTFSGEEAPLSDQAGTSATLIAQVDPNGSKVTACEFEYGTEAGVYPDSVPCASLPGSGREAVAVSGQADEHLEENKEYHWRVSATNAAGTSTSVEHTFNYLTGGEGGAGGLPDDRAYEMVTPPFKNGALVGDVFYGSPPDIAEGEGPGSLQEGSTRVIEQSLQCFDPAESAPSGACDGDRGANGEPFEFTRSDDAQQCEPAAPPCWATTALAPSATEYGENTPWLFSANEGTALFSMPTGKEGEDEWYARSAAGSFAGIGPATPPGSSGIETIVKTNSEKQSTTDFSHLVWESINGSRWPFDETPSVVETLYEYAGAHNTEPLLVGISNVGRPQGGAEHDLISTCGTRLGAGGADAWNALSADGRTIYFTAAGSPSKCFGSGANAHTEVPVNELYARVDGETSEAHTVKISGAGEAVFQGASEDGSKVFFSEGETLYESACTKACETAGEERLSTDVSAGEAHRGEAPGVQSVAAISADGSHVYFVAQGVLTERPNRQGQTAESGKENLYVYERDLEYPDGHTSFITARGISNAGYLTANVTPEGRFLVFESSGDLTPGDTSGTGYNQIFRYDADQSAQEVDEGVPSLLRISTGEEGFNDNGNAGAGDATIVPAIDGAEHAGPARGDPTMSNDGAYVFFQSPIALTPHALNDVIVGHVGKQNLTVYAQNVYEWHEGRVYLISDGHDGSDTNTPCKGRIPEPAVKTEEFQSAVCLLGADASGHNVFFTTADRLVPADTDTQVDTYDARICEPEHGNPCVAESPPPLPPCLGETCHGIPPARSSLLTSGSETFNGAVNPTPVLATAVKPKVLTRAQKLADALRVCKKYKKKTRRASCEKGARKKYRVAKKSSKKSK